VAKNRPEKRKKFKNRKNHFLLQTFSTKFLPKMNTPTQPIVTSWFKGCPDCLADEYKCDCETCYMCGDQYNKRVERQRGNNKGLCPYHFDAEFSEGEPISDSDTDDISEELDSEPEFVPVALADSPKPSGRMAPFFDPVSGYVHYPKRISYSQELEDLMDQAMWDEIDTRMKKPSLSASAMFPTPDIWRKEAPVYHAGLTPGDGSGRVNRGVRWHLVERGRTGVQCVLNMIECTWLPKEIKWIIFHFLGRQHKVSKMTPLANSLFFNIVAHFEERYERHVYADTLAFGDPVLDGWEFSTLFYGTTSACLRCGEIKPEQRSQLLMRGTCYLCAEYGLCADPEEEHNPFNGVRYIIRRGKAGPTGILAVFCPEPGNAWVGQPDRKTVRFRFQGHAVTGLFDSVEFPPLEHPEWLAMTSVEMANQNKTILE
jgi:hypothetical protein